MTGGTQRAYRDSAKKRVALRELYKEAPVGDRPSRQSVRYANRMAGKRNEQVKKQLDRKAKKYKKPEVVEEFQTNGPVQITMS